MTDDITSLSLSSRVVLLAVTHLEEADETPAHTGQVIRAAKDHLESVDAETLGRVSESEVSRALNRLEDADLLGMANDDPSPVGKGRPSYALEVAPGTVIDALADDPEVEPLVDRIAGSSA